MRVRDYFKHPIFHSPSTFDRTKILHYCSSVLGELNGIDNNFLRRCKYETKRIMKTLSQCIYHNHLHHVLILLSQSKISIIKKAP